MSKKIAEWFRFNYRNIIIGSLVIVPLLVSLISTIHVVNFFKLSNYTWLAITLAIAFEIGALSSLAALAVMNKISKVSLWLIFILITLMQMMGNTYYAFDFITGKMLSQPAWTQNWIDLFSISSESVPATKRILAIVSGAILPVISLTFLHMLITYISKSKSQDDDEIEYEEVYVDENGNVIQPNNEMDVIDTITVQSVRTDVDENGKKEKIQDVNLNIEPQQHNKVNEISPTDINDTIDKPRANTILPVIADSTTVLPPVETKQPVQLSNEMLSMISELVKQIKPNATDVDVMELKTQIEKIAVPGSDGKLKIDLGKIMTSKPHLDSVLPSGVYNLEKPELILDKKKDNSKVKTVDSERVTSTIQIPQQDSQGVGQIVLNNIPNTTSSVGVGQQFRMPQRAIDITPQINANGIQLEAEQEPTTILPEKVIIPQEINPIDEPLIIRDTTFENNNTSQTSNTDLINLVETTEDESDTLDELKDSKVPVKRKILLYKEKQKQMYEGYE